MADNSAILAQQVESLVTLPGDNANSSISPSVEDISSGLVKDAFVKALSNPALNLNQENRDKIEELITSAMNSVSQKTVSLDNIKTEGQSSTLYSSSSTHLCSKLSEALRAAGMSGHVADGAGEKLAGRSASAIVYSCNSTHLCGDLSDKSLRKTQSRIVPDLSNCDLKTSKSLIASMSSGLESEVSRTLDSNINTLEQNFSAGQELSQSRLNHVQNLGHSMLIKDVADAKTKSKLSADSVKESEVSKMKEQISTLKTELDKLRPDPEEVSLLCNALDIDPAIATVSHLLILLKEAQDQNLAYSNNILELADKLFATNSLLEHQDGLYTEVKKKLRSIEEEDDTRRENNVQQIADFYADKLTRIEAELKERNIILEEDFWIPHSVKTNEIMSKVIEHKNLVAEEELARELSNAGTDKYSDDEPLYIPVQGFRGSMSEAHNYHTKYFDDDDKDSRDEPGEEASRSVIRARVCVIQ